MRSLIPALLWTACAASATPVAPAAESEPTSGSERPTEVAVQADRLCTILTDEHDTGLEAAARIYERLEREVTHQPLRDAFTELLGASDAAAAQRFRRWLAANGAPGFVCPALDRLLTEE